MVGGLVSVGFFGIRLSARAVSRDEERISAIIAGAGCICGARDEVPRRATSRAVARSVSCRQDNPPTNERRPVLTDVAGDMQLVLTLMHAHVCVRAASRLLWR